MIVILKIAVSALFIFKTVSMPSVSLRAIAVPVFLVVLIVHLRVPVNVFLRRNYILIGFSITFFIFSIISGAVAGRIFSAETALVLYKIAVIYNALYISGMWIGKNGFLKCINYIPSQRLGMFLILFYRIAHAFLKTNYLIIAQLKSRLDFSLHNKLVIVRYYVINLITKELYSLHYYQAALYARFTVMPKVYSAPEPVLFFDTALFAAAVSCCVLDVVM